MDVGTCVQDDDGMPLIFPKEPQLCDYISPNDVGCQSKRWHRLLRIAQFLTAGLVFEPRSRIVKRYSCIVSTCHCQYFQKPHEARRRLSWNLYVVA